jgi:phospholipid/cholesterol/gamma-HCH transport system permease protein
VAPGAGGVPRPRGVREGLAYVGLSTVDVLLKARDFLGFLGLVTVTVLGVLRHPRRVRLVSLVSQMERTGVSALPIVGLLSLLMGVVFAFQGADQLSRFGAEIFTVNLLGIAFLREMGVMLTAIIVAGRSGSAFTAEIGTMQVNEEVDALRTLGLDPIEVLVLPRLLGLTLTLPLLTFYANLMGLLGGALMCWLALDIPLPAFLHQLRTAITDWSFWLGLVKAPFFAACIALTGCHAGLRVTRSAESVGRLTTVSVVQSIFLVILFDAAFSVVFSKLGI